MSTPMKQELDALKVVASNIAKAVACLTGADHKQS